MKEKTGSESVEAYRVSVKERLEKANAQRAEREIEDKIIKNDIHIAIITAPANNAQEICDRLIKAGIKAIWNFAPINLKVPENIAIKNEDLSTSLLVLLKMLEEKI